MAARVAAKLRKESDAEVETVKGRLGEFSVFIEGKEAITTNRFLYPNPFEVVRKVRALLSE